MSVGTRRTVRDMAGGTGIGRRFTVQGWFFLALSLMVLLVVIGTAIGANLLSQTARVTDDLLLRVQPSQTEAYRLQAALVNQETGIRGYAIAADKQFLAPYTSGRQDEARSAARLRGLLRDRPELLADLRAVEHGAAAWRKDYGAPLTAAVTPAGRTPSTRPPWTAASTSSTTCAPSGRNRTPTSRKP